VLPTAPPKVEGYQFFDFTKRPTRSAAIFLRTTFSFATVESQLCWLMFPKGRLGRARDGAIFG